MPTEIWSWQLRSERRAEGRRKEGRRKEGGREGRRERRGEGRREGRKEGVRRKEENTTLIKSRDPHLAGGEFEYSPSSIPPFWWISHWENKPNH